MYLVLCLRVGMEGESNNKRGTLQQRILVAGKREKRVNLVLLASRVKRSIWHGTGYLGQISLCGAKLFVTTKEGKEGFL